MPQDAPVWELMKDADDLVAALISAYPEDLGHISDPEIIGCAAITGKNKPNEKWDAKIEGIKEPAALWSKKVYCISFYKSTWDGYAQNQREAMLFKLLERIPDDCNGKVLPEDLKDSYRLVKKFGTDYMVNPKLPSLIKEKQVFGDRNVPEKKEKEEE